MDLTYGKGGWVRVEGVDLPTYVRLSGNGEVRAIFVDGDGEPVKAAYLRKLGLARIAAVANARPDLMMISLGGPDPQIERAVTGTFPDRRKRRRPSIPATAVLAPPTAGLNDEFLRSVAAAYNAAVARGERPNKALAAQTRYPVRSVERWVYLTRKKGYLPAGRQGRVG